MALRMKNSGSAMFGSIAVREQRAIGGVPALQLRDDRGPADPEVLVIRPDPQLYGELPGMRVEQVGEAVRDLVDVVPPGAGADHLLVHVQHVQPPAQRPQRHQRLRRIAFLPVRGAAPQLERGALQLIRIGDAPGGLSREPPDFRHSHPEERHGRLHVRLLTRREGRIRGVAQRRTDRIDER